MRHVRRMAMEDQSERREALIGILREEELPFDQRLRKQGEHWVENIVIPSGKEGKRLVIGAHYDSVEGSTGANDNAAGVSILIRLAKKLHGRDSGIEIVFFDREEYADHGSEAYIIDTGIENISAMVNLDVCGYGSRIAVADKGNAGNPDFGKLMDRAVLEKNRVTLLGYLPNGDDVMFQKYGIPNISIAVLNDGDVKLFEEISEIIRSGQKPDEDLNRRFNELEIISTMHLGAKDSVDTVSQKSMDMLLEYLIDGLI